MTRAAPPEPARSDWHHLPAEVVLARLGADAALGFDEADLAGRRERYGPNRLPERAPEPRVLRFLRQLHQPLVYILLAAIVITAVLGEWADSSVIFGVVLVNAVVGFVQESNAVNAIRALARTMEVETTVVRSGVRRRLAAVDLVPGDVVLLEPGDRVPADLRLLDGRGLRVDESSLTGESVPAEKRVGTLAPEAALADRTNLAFASTLVTSGAARGVVFATGESTEVGRISEMIASTELLATPLTRKIARFSRRLLGAILGLAAATFAAGVVQGETWTRMFMAAVALAVAAIPEGLPAAMTIMLAIGVARMARRNAIVRRLPAVETLGSTTVICSDKTGTLTRNQMTVQHVFAGGLGYEVTGVGYAPHGQIGPLPFEANPALHQCLLAGLLCNDARLHEDGDVWRVAGDPTEGALIAAAAKAGLSERERMALRRIDAVPFDVEHRYMATLHEREPGRSPVAYVKGSVESLLPRCARSLGPAGDDAPFDAGDVERVAEGWAADGIRVLAFAHIELDPGRTSLSPNDLSAGLTFLGLQGMIDPPRAEAEEAVRRCRSAGIQVKMVTGDHPGTAYAVARSVGLIDVDAPDFVLSGERIAQLSDDDLARIADRAVVFARVSPEQKLRLVGALQARGHVVAMTGDGVNDAPALRRADIGIAMGVAGTEVAKEAADMILTDDDFATIEAAVEEGRGVFDNLTKFLLWTLPTSIGEGLIILFAVFAGAALPILPVQALWINMTTVVLLGLTLAFEPREAGIMRRPPRDPKAAILTNPLLFRIALVGILLLAGSFGLFEWSLGSGASLPEARSVVVNVIVVGETIYLFSCRSLTRSALSIGFFSNRWLLLGVAAMLLLEIGLTYVPVMNRVFHTAPIGADAWVAIVAMGAVIAAAVAAEKTWTRRAALAATGADPRAGDRARS